MVTFMGKLRRYLLGEARVVSLLGGIVRIGISLMIIFSGYIIVIDRAVDDRIFIQATIERTQTMLLACLGTLFFGVWGGFELGRFVNQSGQLIISVRTSLVDDIIVLRSLILYDDR